MRAACLVVLLALAGCSSLTSPAKETRVIEYSGRAEPGIVGTVYVDGDLQVQGCRVVQGKAEPSGCVRYKGDRCEYSSKGCARCSTVRR